MFSLLLLLPALALAAWRPAPGIPLERQLPARSRAAECEDWLPYTEECNNATEIWCNGGYYNDETCWFGNYCLQKVSDWDGCPGVCHTPCHWENEDFCDMGYKTIGGIECWVGNFCQDKSLGGCPSVGSEYASCFEPYTMECNYDTEYYCDAGFDSEGCWYGNYCVQQVNEYDGCPGVCGPNCNYETEDWCEMGYNSEGCWMGAWCQDKGMGGCPVHEMGSGMASGEDPCEHLPSHHQTCTDDQTSCDLGYSIPDSCPYGNYCVANTYTGWDTATCTGECITPCDWGLNGSQEACDNGYDVDGCWMGITCANFADDGCDGVSLPRWAGPNHESGSSLFMKAMERAAGLKK